MQLRNLLLLGVLSSFALTSSSFAAPPPANEPSIPAATVQADVVEAAAKPDDAAALKKKKLAAAKAAEDKKAAKAKAAEDKKLAKAKADAEKQKLAEAKAKEAAKLKKVAEAKAAKEKQLALRAKAAEEKRLAKMKADEARKLASLKAAEERKQLAAAKVKAAEQRKLLLAQAAEERRNAAARQAEAERQAELSRLASMEITKTGNNGELRSESAVAVQQKPVGLFAGLFGGSAPVRQSMLPETQALDAALAQKQARKAFKVKPEFEPQDVTFTGYPRGTIVIDTNARFLYLVNGMSSARRYAIAVGRDGLQYKGTVKVADKQEWPRWIPTLDMQKREPKKYGQYKDGMPGGGENPLGARAIYLYENGKDTHLRIHGTTQPQTIGTNSSNGCFRMINEHVMDLYRRVPVGTNVVVL